MNTITLIIGLTTTHYKFAVDDNVKDEVEPPQLAIYEQAEEEKSGNLSTFAAKRTGKTSKAKSQVADEANAEKTVSDDDSNDDDDEDDSEGSDDEDDEDNDEDDESVTPSKGGRAKSVNRVKRSKKKQTSRKLWSRSVSISGLL